MMPDSFTDLVSEAIADLGRFGGSKNPRVPRTDLQESPAAYPVDVLAPAMREYVLSCAESLNCPPEMIAVPLLVSAGATIGRTRRIQMKRSWTESPILWGVVVAPPGTAKSPAMTAALAPIRGLQAAAMRQFSEADQVFRTALSEWEKTPRDQRNSDGKPKEPTLEHYLTTDSTKESLVVMSANSPGILVSRDELQAWVNSFDAYRGGKGGDRQDMLSMWAGQFLKIDRKGAPSVWSERPVVNVVGGIQPDLVAGLQNDAGRDGFIERFLWAYPHTAPMGWSDKEIDREAELALFSLFSLLRRQDTPEEGAAVVLSTEARDLYPRWHDENAAQQESVSPLVRGMCAKLPTQVARLALVLHCTWYPDPRDSLLSAETMADAIALAEYHRDHAHRVYSRFEFVIHGEPVGLAARILRHLERAREAENPGLSKTDLHRALGNSVESGKIDAALSDLKVAGRIDCHLAEGRGGRTVTLWFSPRVTTANE